MPFCSSCGQEIKTGVKFCPSCGAAQVQGSTGAAEQAVPPQGAQPKQSGRPSKFRFHLVFDLAMGLFTLYEGIIFLLLGATTKSAATLALVVGATLIIIATLSFSVAYGMTKAAPWSWALVTWQGIAYVLLGLLFVPSIYGFVGIIFGVWSLYYVRTKEIKEYLGKLPKAS